MFSLRIVTTSHYQAPPIPGLDCTHSEIRDVPVKRVPVLRIFGSTPAGQKACMHVHGVLPYLYVPYDGTQPTDQYVKQFAVSLDKALNVANRSAKSSLQHVYKIALVSGIPMYGYHDKEEQFLKIYLYNPNNVRKAADLLLGGAVMNKPFQPHESHIPYALQLFIDYNLYGMNLINVGALKFRRRSSGEEKENQDAKRSAESCPDKSLSLSSSTQSSSSSNSSSNKIWNDNNIPSEMWLPSSVERQSACELEVDVVAADILNRQDMDANVGANPGLAALWEDERQRRRDAGESSQIVPDASQERVGIEQSESEKELLAKFLDIVQQQQAFRDSQSEGASQMWPASQSASQVERHLSREDSLASSQSTVILGADEGEDEDGDDSSSAEHPPIVNMDSVYQVVASSQSFSKRGLQGGSLDSQDKTVTELLASLLEEGGSAPSSQIAALEEEDSILHQSLPVSDEQRKEEEEESILMTQDWSVGKDVAKISSEKGLWPTDDDDDIVMGTDDDSDDEIVDLIPQFDGASDKVPAAQNQPAQTNGPESNSQGTTDPNNWAVSQGGPSQMAGNTQGYPAQMGVSTAGSSWPQQQSQQQWSQGQSWSEQTGQWPGTQPQASGYSQNWPQQGASTQYPFRSPAPAGVPSSPSSTAGNYPPTNPYGSPSHPPQHSGSYQSPSSSPHSFGQYGQSPYHSPSSSSQDMFQTPAPQHPYQSPSQSSHYRNQPYSPSQPFQSPQGAGMQYQSYPSPGHGYPTGGAPMYSPYQSPSHHSGYPQSPRQPYPYHSPTHHGASGRFSSPMGWTSQGYNGYYNQGGGQPPGMSGQSSGSVGQPSGAGTSTSQPQTPTPPPPPKPAPGHYAHARPRPTQATTKSESQLTQSPLTARWAGPSTPTSTTGGQMSSETSPCMSTGSVGESKDNQSLSSTSQTVTSMAPSTSCSGSGQSMSVMTTSSGNSGFANSDAKSNHSVNSITEAQLGNSFTQAANNSDSEKTAQMKSTEYQSQMSQPFRSPLPSQSPTSQGSGVASSPSVSGSQEDQDRTNQIAAKSSHAASTSDTSQGNKISTLEFNPVTSAGDAPKPNSSNESPTKQEMKNDIASATPMIQQLLTEESPAKMNISPEEREAALKKPMASPSVPTKGKKKATKSTKNNSTSNLASQPPPAKSRQRSTSMSYPNPMAPGMPPGYSGYPSQPGSPLGLQARPGRSNSISLPFSSEQRMPAPGMVPPDYAWQQQQWRQQQQQQSMMMPWQQQQQQQQQQAWMGGSSQWPGYNPARVQQRSFSADSPHQSYYQNSYPQQQMPPTSQSGQQQQPGLPVSQEQPVSQYPGMTPQPAGAQSFGGKKDSEDKSSLSSLFQLVSDVGSNAPTDNIPTSTWDSCGTPTVVPSLFSDAINDVVSDTPKSTPPSDKTSESPLIREFASSSTDSQRPKQSESKTNSETAGITCSEESDKVESDNHIPKVTDKAERSKTAAGKGPFFSHTRLGKLNRMKKMGLKPGQSTVESGPNPAYTYMFHVPTPVFKKLKFYKRPDPNRPAVSVVRMHPMDARRYSLLKVGRELVRVVKLTDEDLARHNVTLPFPTRNADGTMNRVNLDIPTVSTDRSDSGEFAPPTSLLSSSPGEESGLSPFDTDFPPNRIAPPSSFDSSQVTMSSPRASNAGGSPRTPTQSSHSDWPIRQYPLNTTANGGNSLGISTYPGQSYPATSPMQSGPNHPHHPSHPSFMQQQHLAQQYSGQQMAMYPGKGVQSPHPSGHPSTSASYMMGPQQGYYPSAGPYMNHAQYPHPHYQAQYNAMHQQQQANFRSQYPHHPYQQQPQLPAQQQQQQQPPQCIPAENNYSNMEPKNGLRSPGQHGPTTTSSNLIDRCVVPGHRREQEEREEDEQQKGVDTPHLSGTVGHFTVNSRANAEERENHAELKARTHVTVCNSGLRVSSREIQLHTTADTAHNNEDDTTLTHVTNGQDKSPKFTITTGKKRRSRLSLKRPLATPSETASPISCDDSVDASNPASDSDHVSEADTSLSKAHQARGRSVKSRNTKSLQLIIPPPLACSLDTSTGYSTTSSTSNRTRLKETSDEGSSLDGGDYSPIRDHLLSSFPSRKLRHTRARNVSYSSSSKRQKKKKNEPQKEGIHYIVVGKFKGHRAMLVKVKPVAVSLNEAVDAKVFEDQAKKEIVRVASYHLKESDSDIDISHYPFSRDKIHHSDTSIDKMDIEDFPSSDKVEVQSVGDVDSEASLSYGESSELEPTNHRQPKNGQAGPFHRKGASKKKMAARIVKDMFFSTFKKNFTQRLERMNRNRVQNVAMLVSFFPTLEKDKVLNFQEQLERNCKRLKEESYSSSSDDEDDYLEDLILKEKIHGGPQTGFFVLDQSVRECSPVSLSTSIPLSIRVEEDLNQGPFEMCSAIKDVDNIEEILPQPAWSQKQSMHSRRVGKENSEGCPQEDSMANEPIEADKNEQIAHINSHQVSKKDSTNNVNNESNRSNNQQVEQGDKPNYDSNVDPYILSTDKVKEDYLKKQMAFFEDISSDSDSNPTLMIDNASKKLALAQVLTINSGHTGSHQKAKSDTNSSQNETSYITELKTEVISPDVIDSRNGKGRFTNNSQSCWTDLAGQSENQVNNSMKRETNRKLQSNTSSVLISKEETEAQRSVSDNEENEDICISPDIKEAPNTDDIKEMNRPSPNNKDKDDPEQRHYNEISSRDEGRSPKFNSAVKNKAGGLEMLHSSSPSVHTDGTIPVKLSSNLENSVSMDGTVAVKLNSSLARSEDGTVEVKLNSGSTSLQDGTIPVKINSQLTTENDGTVVVKLTNLITDSPDEAMPVLFNPQKASSDGTVPIVLSSVDTIDDSPVCRVLQKCVSMEDGTVPVLLKTSSAVEDEIEIDPKTSKFLSTSDTGDATQYNDLSSIDFSLLKKSKKGGRKKAVKKSTAPRRPKKPQVKPIQYEHSSSNEDEGVKSSLPHSESSQSVDSSNKSLRQRKQVRYTYCLDRLDSSDNLTSSDEDRDSDPVVNKSKKKGKGRGKPTATVTSTNMVIPQDKPRPRNNQGKKKKGKGKLSNSLSLLHMATLASLTDMQTDSLDGQSADSAEPHTYSCRDTREETSVDYTSSLENMSFISPPTSEDVESSPPLPFSPTDKKKLVGAKSLHARGSISASRRALHFRARNHHKVKPGVNGACNMGCKPLPFTRLMQHPSAPSSPVFSSHSPFEQGSSETLNNPSGSGTWKDPEADQRTLQLLETKKAQVNCASFSMSDILKMTSVQHDDSMDSDSKDSAAMVKPPQSKRAQVKSTSLSMSDIMIMANGSPDSLRDSDGKDDKSAIARPPQPKKAVVKSANFSMSDIVKMTSGSREDSVDEDSKETSATVQASQSNTAQVKSESLSMSDVINLTSVHQKEQENDQKTAQASTSLLSQLAAFDRPEYVVGIRKSKLSQKELSSENSSDKKLSRQSSVTDTIIDIEHGSISLNKCENRSSQNMLGKNVANGSNSQNPVLENEEHRSCQLPKSDQKSDKEIVGRNSSDVEYIEKDTNDELNLGKDNYDQHVITASGNRAGDFLKRSKENDRLNRSQLKEQTYSNGNIAVTRSTDNRAVNEDEKKDPSLNTKVPKILITGSDGVSNSEDKLSATREKDGVAAEFPRPNIQNHSRLGHGQISEAESSASRGQRQLQPLHPLQIPSYPYTAAHPPTASPSTHSHPTRAELSCAANNAPSNSFYSSYPYCWQWPVPTGSVPDPMTSPLNLCTSKKSPNTYSPITPTSPVSPYEPITPQPPKVDMKMSPPLKKPKPLWYPWLTGDSIGSKSSTPLSSSPHRKELRNAGSIHSDRHHIDQSGSKFRYAEEGKKGGSKATFNSSLANPSSNAHFSGTNHPHSSSTSTKGQYPSSVNSKTPSVHKSPVSAGKTVSQIVGSVIETAYEQENIVKGKFHQRQASQPNLPDRKSPKGLAENLGRDDLRRGLHEKMDGSSFHPNLVREDPTQRIHEMPKASYSPKQSQLEEMTGNDRWRWPRHNQFEEDQRRQAGSADWDSFRRESDREREYFRRQRDEERENQRRLHGIDYEHGNRHPDSLDGGEFRRQAEFDADSGRRRNDNDRVRTMLQNEKLLRDQFGMQESQPEGNRMDKSHGSLTDLLVTKLIKGGSESATTEPSDAARGRKRDNKGLRPTPSQQHSNTSQSSSDNSRDLFSQRHGHRDGRGGNGRRSSPPASPPSTRRHDSDVTLRPNQAPPSRSSVEESLTRLGLNTVQPPSAYCSSAQDLPERPMEHGGRVLKVDSKRLCELQQFISCEHVHGIEVWRSSSISSTQLLASQTEGKPLSERLRKDPQLRFLFCQDRKIVVSPCHPPPGRASVLKWLQQKMRLVQDAKMKTEEKKKPVKEPQERGKSRRKSVMFSQHPQASDTSTLDLELDLEDKDMSMLSDHSLDDSSTLIDTDLDLTLTPASTARRSMPGTSQKGQKRKIPFTPERRESGELSLSPEQPTLTEHYKNTKKRKESETTESKLSGESVADTTATPVRHRSGDLFDASMTTPGSGGTVDEKTPTMLKHISSTTENLLRREVLSSMTQRQPSVLGFTAAERSQIEGPTPKNTYGFKVAQDNMHDAKALHKHQYVTALSLEMHIDTRGDLRPDPEFDAIMAIFYSVFDDVPEGKGQRSSTGVIVVDKESWTQVSKRNSQNKCSTQGSSKSSDSDQVGLVDLPGPIADQSGRVSPGPSSSPAPTASPSRPTTPTSKGKGRGKGRRSASPRPSSQPKTPTGSCDQALTERCAVDGVEVTYVQDELDLLQTFTQLLHKFDPDILVGFEIQMLSWGYLLARGAQLGVELCSKISRVKDAKEENRYTSDQDEWGADHMSEIHIAGRIVLNLWRILRHEVTLNTYTFENVAYHVLHQRIPLYSFRSLTKWYNHNTALHRWRVFEHYLRRVKGQLEVIDQLDIIGKTSEFARVFGIEFYDVLARGSQIRVESMMLRLAKPMNYVPVSPSVAQRARQRAPECIPLTLEPESQYYTSPVVVLDFQSLYPSIMIAYNYCFSTCLGRLEFLENAHEGPLQFGCSTLSMPPRVLKKLRDKVTISPNGVAFVKSSVRRGVLPKMVEEILNTRLMVKKSMKAYKDDKTLARMLDARQLGLKLIANVTYGYTGASFSGRMPCIEVGDSIVRKARESLERAIELVEKTPRWGAKVVYGDTDSLFIQFPGRSKDEAFVLGQEIADAVTNMFPSPMKLKFEKVYLPCVLQTKKRYVGYMYETPDQVEPVYDAKGIETVRRDSCSAVAKILERSIKVLFATHDLSRVRAYVTRQLHKLLEGKVSILDLIFAKEFRGLMGYKPGACVPALEIARKRINIDRRAEPRVGERVPYVIVHGSPGLPLIQLVREPQELITDVALRLNATYYITKQILPPLDRLFSLIGVNVFTWYQAMPKVERVGPMIGAAPSSKQGTISQFFATSNCPVCDTQTKRSVCDQCMKDPQLVVTTITQRMRDWDATFHRLKQVCDTCQGTQDSDQTCISMDCPFVFRMAIAQQDLQRASTIKNLLDKLQF